ncbi:TonB-dependent receptor domain-containing protein [Aliarcobacter skirrowii]|uniref:TonB-dependent receptor n=1 Tax=Aliarcobacter skirrowii CCUG 10374 TaxID=1032239 RepID=A0AAD0WMS7_9BACT|nr:TonB-dependent receptor [Aliarcobacter skirrowii]AXX84162.1 TonB-dependent siderophore receptor [Aliarcobacter skirrowii CCUG 10374]KAB0621653.1 TonB-dependent receptor [Aliarcobacter skirrowii CCUG 10374]RXI26906.1 TonB-dependent receptor [Aliarcobacter skirrowii CCUG 10374]SUV14318.1 Brucella heme uptake protein A [Aliarcobacter skirrowii]
MKSNIKATITLSFILASDLAFAQNIALQKVTIEEKKEIETNTMQINMQQVEQSQANSFKEILNNNSSIEIGGGAINVQRVYLRGIESSNLNISLDGAKQGKNMFQHRSNELGINPDLLKVVDIKTSNDASKSQALGGSIQMSTKDAQDFVKGDKKSGAILKIGYNTNANQKHGSLIAYSVFENNLGAYVSVSGLNSDDYKDGKKNKEIATAYKDRDYLFKLSLLDSNNHDLRLTINQNENSGNTRWRGTEYRPKPEELEKIVSTTTNYTLNHTYNPNNLVNLNTNLNLTDISLKREEPKNNLNIRLDGTREYENRNIGLKVQNHFDFDISSTTNRVSIGADYQKEHGKGSFEPHNLDKVVTKYSNLDSENKALFFQNRTTIGSLGFDYGLRYDYYTFETGLGKQSDDTFSPNIGIDYEATQNSLIYANYGKASRMSSIIPFTWALNTKIGSTYSKDLKAEKSNRYELGYKYSKKDTFLSDDYLSFNANIFQTNIKDLIVSGAIGGGSGEGGRTLEDIYNKNDEFKSKGFELKLIYNYDIFSTSFAYTQIDTNAKNMDTNGTIYNEDQNIRRVGGYDSKKFVFNGGVEIIENLNINYILNAVAKTDVLDSNNNEIRRAGYTTHDINLEYKLKDWTLFFAINNLTNKQYAKATTISTKNQADVYRYEMGRDYRFALKYEF